MGKSPSGTRDANKSDVVASGHLTYEKKAKTRLGWPNPGAHHPPPLTSNLSRARTQPVGGVDCRWDGQDCDQSILPYSSSRQRALEACISSHEKEIPFCKLFVFNPGGRVLQKNKQRPLQALVCEVGVQVRDALWSPPCCSAFSWDVSTELISQTVRVERATRQ